LSVAITLGVRPRPARWTDTRSQSCCISKGTGGLKGDGIAAPSTVTLLLGTINSKPVSVSVTISATGVVTVNSFTIGNVTLVAATGAAS